MLNTIARACLTFLIHWATFVHLGAPALFVVILAANIALEVWMRRLSDQGRLVLAFKIGRKWKRRYGTIAAIHNLSVVTAMDAILTSVKAVQRLGVHFAEAPPDPISIAPEDIKPPES